MTQDFSALKVGDTVKLRCGGIVQLPDSLEKKERVFGFDCAWWFYDGRFSQSEHPLDIIEVIGG